MAGLKPYRVQVNGAEVVMMLDEQDAKRYPDAQPGEANVTSEQLADDPEVSPVTKTDDDSEVSHKARRPARHASRAKDKD